MGSDKRYFLHQYTSTIQCFVFQCLKSWHIQYNVKNIAQHLTFICPVCSCYIIFQKKNIQTIYIKLTVILILKFSPKLNVHHFFEMLNIIIGIDVG